METTFRFRFSFHYLWYNAHLKAPLGQTVSKYNFLFLSYSFFKDLDFALKYLVHIIPTQMLWMSGYVVYIIKNDIIQIISMELYLKEKIVLIFKRYYICWGIICSITVFHIIIFVALSSQNLEQKPNFIIFLHQAFSSEMFFIF